MSGSDKHLAGFQVSSLQRMLEQRLANPLFRSLLKSRLHWLASNWLMLITYQGRRSGHRYTLPVAYKQLDEQYVVVTPKHESNWWKNFQESQVCTIWLRGEKRSATGDLSAENKQRILTEYFDTYGLLGRILGVEDRAASSNQIEQIKQELAVVQFTIDTS